MTTASKDVPVTLGITRKSLEAVKIFACSNCEAPGVFKNDKRTQELWPGCWNPQKLNRPVGDVCPNCGASRRADKDLGELTASMPRWIWSCVLAFKWCVVKVTTLKRRTGERYV